MDDFKVIVRPGCLNIIAVHLLNSSSDSVVFHVDHERSAESFDPCRHEDKFSFYFGKENADDDGIGVDMTAVDIYLPGYKNNLDEWTPCVSVGSKSSVLIMYRKTVLPDAENCYWYKDDDKE